MPPNRPKPPHFLHTLPPSALVSAPRSSRLRRSAASQRLKPTLLLPSAAATAPFPSPSSPSPSVPLAFFFPFRPLRSRPPSIQLGGLGECCKLPQRSLLRSRSGNRIWCLNLVPENLTSDGIKFKFTNLLENQLLTTVFVKLQWPQTHFQRSPIEADMTRR